MRYNMHVEGYESFLLPRLGPRIRPSLSVQRTENTPRHRHGVPQYAGHDASDSLECAEGVYACTQGTTLYDVNFRNPRAQQYRPKNVVFAFRGMFGG